MIKTKYYSYRKGNLPKGCRQCVKGEKLVLFVTGICPRKCYYCPLSDEKSQKEVTYANERPVPKHDVKTIIEEAKACNSKGAGMTGGDPLAKLKRTIRYIKALKKEFGKEFHIHLYTSLQLVDEKTLKRIYSAGLDEIRFHPDIEKDRLWNRIKLAGKFDWDYGVEIPAIPGKKKETKKLMDFLEGKIKFLNINELEVSDGKTSKLREKGFKTKNKLSYAVKGSEEMAKDLLKYAEKKGFKYKVHHCTAKLKDKIQLAERIKRRAKNTAKEYDIITEEGLLQRGAIYGKDIKELRKTKRWLIEEVEVPEKLVEIDKGRKRLMTNPGVVMHLAEEMKEKGLKPAIVKEYPTWDRLTIELDWV